MKSTNAILLQPFRKNSHRGHRGHGGGNLLRAFFSSARSVLSVCSVAILLALPVAAQSAKARPATRPAAKQRSLDSSRLALITPRLQSFVDRGRAAGIVALVAHRGEVINQTAVGVQDLESRAAMKPDTIFQIMSMTKPITAVGIMILAEDGRLAITDPVEKYLPGFANLQIRTRKEGEELEEIRKPARKITLRDLLTHTSGMGSVYPDAFKDLFNKRDRTLAEAVEAFPQMPLNFEPGTQWGYSNLGIATLGRIIELVSGQPYEEFLTARVFRPLGMKDSHFFVPEEKRPRIAAVYKLDGDQLTKADVDLYRIGAKYPAPEAGLYSTAPDLLRFYQMMLNGGELGGQRILSPASVELMTQNHTGDFKAGFSPGIGFGLGWAVVRNTEGQFRLNSIGTYGHGGLYHTFAFVDPQKDLIGIILMQRLSSDGDMADEFSAFSQMASAAVLK